MPLDEVLYGLILVLGSTIIGSGLFIELTVTKLANGLSLVWSQQAPG